MTQLLHPALDVGADLQRNVCDSQQGTKPCICDTRWETPTTQLLFPNPPTQEKEKGNTALLLVSMPCFRGGVKAVPSSNERFKCPYPLFSHPDNSCSVSQHTPALPPGSHLLVLSSEGSWLGLLCQLPIVMGELVGQYAQLIWVGGGFGDLLTEEKQELDRARRAAA